MIDQQTILVWDWPVRVGHWLLVILFALAWLTGDSEELRLIGMRAGMKTLRLAGARKIAAASLEQAPLDISVKSDAAGWAAKLGAEVLPTGSLRLAAEGRVEDLAGAVAHHHRHAAAPAQGVDGRIAVVGEFLPVHRALLAARRRAVGEGPCGVDPSPTGLRLAVSRPAHPWPGCPAAWPWAGTTPTGPGVAPPGCRRRCGRGRRRRRRRCRR